MQTFPPGIQNPASLDFVTWFRRLIYLGVLQYTIHGDSDKNGKIVSAYSELVCSRAAQHPITASGSVADVTGCDSCC